MCTGHGALIQLAPGDPFVFIIGFKGFGNLYPEAIERVTIPRNAVPYVGPRGRGLPNESEAGFEDSAHCGSCGLAWFLVGFQRVTEKFPKASVDIPFLLLG